MPYPFQLIKMPRGQEVRMVGKVPFHKEKDLDPIDRAHTKKPCVTVCICNPSSKEVETDRSLSLLAHSESAWVRRDLS